MLVVDSPFTPHGLGDQTWPMDQRITPYDKRTPQGESAFDANQRGRLAMSLVPTSQHLEEQKTMAVENLEFADCSICRWRYARDATISRPIVNRNARTSEKVTDAPLD